MSDRDTSTGGIDIEALLLHAEWVTGLARRLVLDAASADDVVQDTWARTLEHPPRHAENLRGWLARAVRNAARQVRRSDRRRARREHAVARPESTAGHELAVMQRDVLSHVLELDEPFRSTVLQRFFEDLSPPEIAERTGVPLKTVHSRLQRGLERLRTRLDREHGDRAAWMAAFLPLVQPALPVGAGPAPTAPNPPPIPSAAVGPSWLDITWIMNLNLRVLLVVAAATAGGVGLWRTISSDRAGALAGPSDEPALEVAELPAPAAMPEQTVERVDVAPGGAAVDAAASVPMPRDPETSPSQAEPFHCNWV